MSNYQTRISELLEHCQNEWVKLESISATSQTSRELKEVIKQLVQLLDNLDESHFASFYGIHLRAAKFRSMEEIVREEKRFRSVIYSDNSYQCYH